MDCLHCRGCPLIHPKPQRIVVEDSSRAQIYQQHGLLRRQRLAGSRCHCHVMRVWISTDKQQCETGGKKEEERNRLLIVMLGWVHQQKHKSMRKSSACSSLAGTSVLPFSPFAALRQLTWHPALSHSSRLCVTRPHKNTGLRLCAWCKWHSLARPAAYKKNTHAQNKWTL